MSPETVERYSQKQVEMFRDMALKRGVSIGVAFGGLGGVLIGMIIGYNNW
jgi:hypothetical protein